MSGQLEQVTSEFFSAIDSMDVDRIMRMATEDAEGVDEISRQWQRGRDQMDGYLRQLMGSVSDVHTELRDQHERVWGDAGVVTCWIDQDYTLGGKSEHISAPTTMVFRREGSDWKLALFHSVPLAEQS